MPKAIVTILLAVISSMAAAEWVELSVTDVATFYGDPATLRRTGNIVKLWCLLDYKEPDTFNKQVYMSQRSQLEFDCKEEQWRTLYFTYFQKSMGDGKAIFVNPDPDKWTPVPPRTPAEVLWKFACGKR